MKNLTRFSFKTSHALGAILFTIMYTLLNRIFRLCKKKIITNEKNLRISYYVENF